MNAQYTPQEAHAMEEMLCKLYWPPAPPKEPELSEKQVAVRARRNAILNAIEHGPKNMKYLKKHFPDLSQGQIGHDIDALVKAGRVKREGSGNRIDYVYAGEAA